MKKRYVYLIIAVALFCSACGKNDNVNEKGTTEITDDRDTIADSEVKASSEEIEKSEETEEDELPFDKISVARWDDLSHDFYIDAKLYYAKNYYEYSSACDYKLPPEENIKKIYKKNKEYMTVKGNYTDYEGEDHEAVYYFNNNNAYVLYGTEESEGVTEITKSTWVHLRNRMIWDDYVYFDYDKEIADEYIVKVPFPVCVSIDYYSVRDCWEKGESLDEKYLFSHCTYDEAKEFYNMFSEGTATFNDEIKVIQVCATLSSKKTNEIKQVLAILDFKNKTYEVKSDDGTFVHSYDTMCNEIESEYKSAGTIDGKEVIYSTYGVIIKENGKHRILMREEELNDYLDEIPGYNCVGEDISLKLTKIKNDKYYFDVTATLEEDGKWTEKEVLVVKDKSSK